MTQRETAWSVGLYAVAALSVLAGMIHAMVTVMHFDEWWGFGLFFLATVVAQLIYAPSLLRWPSRRVFLLGIGLNLAIAAVWLMSRTVGIPLIGPEPGEIEPIGLLDVVSTTAEVGLALLLAVLAATEPTPTEDDAQRFSPHSVSA